MKFYIASKLDNFEQVRTLACLLKKAGWEHTYDWTSNDLTKEIDTQTLSCIAQKEYEGVIDADIVIILTPQGRGTHTEFGIAIALNKIIYLCNKDDTYFKCDNNTSSFYWLSKINHLIGNTEYISSYLINKYSNNIPSF